MKMPVQKIRSRITMGRILFFRSFCNSQWRKIKLETKTTKRGEKSVSLTFKNYSAGIRKKTSISKD